MIKTQIRETFILPNNKGYAVDNDDNHTTFNRDRKEMAYYSSTCDKLGLYDNFDNNLIQAKILFLKSMKRQRKIVYGNRAYLRCTKGLYADIIYLDFKHFYQEVFSQIANHIDEDYFGKEIKGIVVKKQFFKNTNTKFSDTARKKPLVNINDIANNSVKLDINQDKGGLIKLTQELNDTENATDSIDKGVAKMTRNALAFGFGFQQKNASISNISAMVMFIAKELMEISVNELEARGDRIIFSHTDSFMLNHANTKNLDDSVKFATGQLNEKYFFGVPILKFDFGSLGIKNKFDELMVLNQNSYIYKDRYNKTKLAISGINTTKNNGIGISAGNELLEDIINEHSNEIFSKDKEFFNKYKDTEFLYSGMKYRLDEGYTDKLIAWWNNKDKRLEKRIVVISKTISNINILLQNQ